MKTEDLLALAEAEARRLDDAGNKSAAIIMRALAERARSSVVEVKSVPIDFELYAIEHPDEAPWLKSVGLVKSA